MPPTTAASNHKYISTGLIENDTLHSYSHIIGVMMMVFITMHILTHMDRFVLTLLRLYLPARVHPTLKDVLPSPASELDYPFVAIQLPMLNEIECCEAIIECACNLDWPRSRFFVQVLDDSTCEEARIIVDKCVQRWICRGAPIGVFRRQNRQGFKAGALINGMPFIRHAEYIAIFDADFLPTKDYLLRMVPILIHDSTVAFVQARWTFTNAKESLLTRMQEIALNFHHKCEQEGRYRASLYFTFNGTGGVWRASAIEQAGGWHTDSLVEDLDLSLRVYINGWHSVYLEDVECLNELPPTLSAYLSQQHRWNSGPIQIIRKLAAAICRTKHISWLNKISCLWYLIRNFVHIFNTILLIMVVPLDIYGPRWSIYSVVSIILLIAHSLCITVFTRHGIRLTFLYVAFVSAMSLHNACAVISGLFKFGLAQQWIVTPKFGLHVQDTHSTEKSTEKMLTVSQPNQAIFVRWKARNMIKPCFRCLSVGTSLIVNLFLKLNQRIYHKVHSVRFFKRNLCMGIYLFVASYVTLRRGFYVSSIYTFFTAITFIILAFGIIGRSH